MEIKGTSRIETSAIRRKTAAASSGGNFQVSESAEPHAQIVAGPGPIATLDSILALQDMGDPVDGRSKGLAHGEQLLEILDSVRDGLLSGGIPRATLNRLAGGDPPPRCLCRSQAAGPSRPDRAARPCRTRQAGADRQARRLSAVILRPECVARRSWASCPHCSSLLLSPQNSAR